MLLGPALTVQLWLHIKSDKMAHSFVVLLLGEDISDSDLHSLCQGRYGWSGDSEDTCQYILDRMVTAHLETRGYHLTCAHPESIINSWSDIEDKRKKMENVSEAAVSESGS